MSPYYASENGKEPPIYPKLQIEAISSALFDSINEAARDLPDKCEIHIVIENGEAYVEAYDKTGGFVDFDEHPELADSIRDALRHIIEHHEP